MNVLAITKIVHVIARTRFWLRRRRHRRRCLACRTFPNLGHSRARCGIEMLRLADLMTRVELEQWAARLIDDQREYQESADLLDSIGFNREVK